MYCKIIKVKIKKAYPLIDVIVFLNNSLCNGQEQVRFHCMVNEYFLIEDILFDNRDAAYEFIKHCTLSLVKDFIIRKYIDKIGEAL